MQDTAIFVGIVFVLTYIMIVWEKVHRTVVALVGAMLLVLTGIISQERAVHAIEFNTIGLLIGMMIIVSITRRTGLFEFLAVWTAKVAQARPGRIMMGLALLTAVASALLDNVTTVLLVVPVTIEIVSILRVNPVPFLIVEIIASNIGGTATLIGDPPNIMIGGYTGLSFISFIVNLAPVAIIIFIVTMAILWFLYKSSLDVEEKNRRDLLELNEFDTIDDTVLLKKCLFVLGLTILGFVLHGYLGLESASIALGGAALLLLISGAQPEGILEGVEWQVIFFFVGLFILVGALEEVGIIKMIAKSGMELTGGEMVSTGLLILWLSAVASAFVDNIPFVATMIPLVDEMGTLANVQNINPWWWALALGGCLGGNGSLVGAAANVVAVGLAERRNVQLTFLGFLKVGFPIMLLSVFIAMLYLLLFYF
ncbi:MAG: ArsB/NhaD family transporter [Clostridiales bacterium]|nr:ArsB/NhaD family transporter [Clostridiales bacterium]MCF8022540.1 ArsB/NhaD family transporter [Clostridiales bacterium]